MSEHRAASIRRLATLLDWQRHTELIDASYLSAVREIAGLRAEGHAVLGEGGRISFAIAPQSPKAPGLAQPLGDCPHQISSERRGDRAEERFGDRFAIALPLIATAPGFVGWPMLAGEGHAPIVVGLGVHRLPRDPH